MDVLPVELQTEILLRLPATTLATTARRVCRQWQSIISSPIFVKDQLIRSIEDHTTFLFHRNLSKPNDGLVIYSSSIGDVTHIGPKGILPEENFAYRPITLVCNGLVLYIYLEHLIVKFYLCNPVLNQCISLEPIIPRLGIRVRIEPIATTYKNWGFGFGFDPITNRYKVVVISRSTNPRSRTTSEVFCSTVDVVSEEKTISSWRRLGGLSHTVGEDTIGLFFNGRLHWALSDTTDDLVLCVDLNTEEFSSSPRTFDWNCWIKSFSFSYNHFCHWKKCAYNYRDSIDLYYVVHKMIDEIVGTIHRGKINREFSFVSGFVPCLVSLDRSHVDFQEHRR